MLKNNRNHGDNALDVEESGEKGHPLLRDPHHRHQPPSSLLPSPQRRKRHFLA